MRDAQIAHIELRREEHRCVDCGNHPFPLSPFWTHCRQCQSLVCRTCRKRAEDPLTGHWQCPGCGGGRDALGHWHDGFYETDHYKGEGSPYGDGGGGM